MAPLAPGAGNAGLEGDRADEGVAERSRDEVAVPAAYSSRVPCSLIPCSAHKLDQNSDPTAAHGFSMSAAFHPERH